MDPTDLATGGAIGGIGGVLMAIYNKFVGDRRVDEIEKDARQASDAVKDLALHVARNHPTNDDIKSLSETLFQKLDKIDEKLDNKADK